MAKVYLLSNLITLKLKILIVGLGSMGKRRIRNLKKLGYNEIIGFDLRNDRRNEVSSIYKIPTVKTISEGLGKKPDCMIISTPPDLHYKYAEIAINNNIHFFTEVNLFSNDVSKIIKKLKQKNIIGAPSCTLLYNPVVKKLKQLISEKRIGKPLTVYHHFGHYLPNWHPWENYQKFYVAKKETGGAREIIPFELVWLTHLFSEIKSVYGSIHKVSNLKVDIDDIYEILLEFKNGIQCILVVDVITAPAINETKIIGEKGVIVCDHNKELIKIGLNNKWKVLKLKSGKVAKGYKGNTPSESLYEDEMQIFFRAIQQKKKYPFTFESELNLLKILDAIELSNKKSKKIHIK